MSKKLVLVIIGLGSAAAFFMLQPSALEKCMTETREEISQSDQSWILEIPDPQIQNIVAKVIKEYCEDKLRKK